VAITAADHFVAQASTATTAADHFGEEGFAAMSAADDLGEETIAAMVAADLFGDNPSPAVPAPAAGAAPEWLEPLRGIESVESGWAGINSGAAGRIFNKNV
jgi:hypothetical protein